NEMSCLKGRVEVMSRPHWRLEVDAVISGPSFGAGNEDQGSHHTGDQRKNQLDPGSRDFRDVRPAIEAMAEQVGQVWLRRTVQPPNPATESEASGDGKGGKGITAVSREVL